MFTGIVETTGTITDRSVDGDSLRLTIETALSDGLDVGASVSVSGVCLTAERVDPPTFEVFLAAETRERTYLDTLAVGDRINIERPLPVDGRLDGHIVQGHVDATISVREREALGEDWRYVFDLPTVLAPYVVEKGSVAIDGISLTVAEIEEDGGFSVALIPETLSRTTIGEKEPGDPVHLEVDVVARYVEQMLPV